MALTRVVRLSNLIQSWVALGRLNSFLQETELIDRYEAGSPTAVSDDPSYIGFRNATFAWLKDVPADCKESNFKLHFDGDLLFPIGKISLVAGQTGCGKTSLLMALLGEMHFEQRGPDSSFGLPRTGGVAYASQQSWLQNLSLRDNILFGAPFDEERYNLVVKDCALERDFTLFDAGDATEVGEKGLTLSGGQKARVTLARAIYSRADVLLLDDILSALDVHTSKFIVDNLLKGSLVKNRTVLLVTHHVDLALQVADYLVTLEDGRVKSHGSISELKRVESSLFKEAEPEEPEKAVAAEIEAVEGPIDATLVERASDGKLVMAEEKAEGRMSKRAFMLLFSSLDAHPWLHMSIVLGGLLVDCIFITLQSAWLGVWSRAYEGNGNPDPVYYLGVLSAIVGVAMLAYAVGAARWYIGTVRAGIVIHQQVRPS
jgi:ABC-type nitrate/sulfonate/bicarbonate transport system ATPase subunit